MGEDLKRKYENIDLKDVHREILIKLKQLFLYFPKPDKKIIFHIEAMQKLSDQQNLLSLQIPENLPQSWIDMLPQQFTVNAVIQDFDAYSGKAMNRFLKVVLLKHSQKERKLLVVPLKYALASEYRRQTRYPNKTTDIFADHFLVSSDTLDLNRKKSFLSGVFKNARFLIQKHFHDVEINFFEKNDAPSLQLVKEKKLPLWIPDYQNPELRVDSLWHWKDRSYPFLALTDLRDYSDEFDMELAKGVGLNVLSAKINAELILPILHQEKGEEILIGYVRVWSQGKIPENGPELLQQQMQWIDSALNIGKDMQLASSARIVDFNHLGCKMELTEDDLIENLKDQKTFQFKFHFPINLSGDMDVHAKVVYHIVREEETVDIGVKFVHFEPKPDAHGNFIDGQLFFIQALKKYRKEIRL